MTSLSEVYEHNQREVSSLRRLYAGTGLVLAGAALAVLALLVATTDLFGFLVSDTYAARELAGILGGLAVPAVLVGVFTVLPTGRRIKAAAAISASISLLGVLLFRYAYPTHWDGYGQDLTLFVSAIYLAGLFSAVWCLFTAIANFKTRNDPGGALLMNVTCRGETKIVEVDRSGGMGGVGLLGATPDGEVETQTNAPGAGVAGAASTTTDTGSATPSRSPSPTGGVGVTPSPASDGGATDTDITSPLDDAGPSATDQSAATDQYCGNCHHFEYVRGSSGMVPYCGYRSERMADMDACEEWEPNRPH